MSEQHWQDVKTIWRQNQWLYIFAGFVAGIGVFPAARALITIPNGMVENMIAESFGIVITVLVIDRLYQRRERARRRYERREQLIHEMGSPDNATAVNAARGLRTMGAVQDGTLRNIRLLYANLAGANLFRGDLRAMNLSNANLEGANMVEADLSDASLRKANLHEAKLAEANLSDVKLNAADLTGTNLKRANLRGAVLTGADLRGAILAGADLTGAQLFDVIFSSSTIMPDGSHWHEGETLFRFNSTKHPHYWRSNDPKSPAYHKHGAQ
jgi:hypothetical protein